MTDLNRDSSKIELATYARSASRRVGVRSRTRLVLGGAIGLTLFALLYGVQMRYLQKEFSGQVHPWALTLRVALVHWYLWGLLTIPIAIISRHIRFGAIRLLPFLALHLALAIVMTLAHVALRTTWQWMFEQVDPTFESWQTAFGWLLLVDFHWGLLTYAGIACSVYAVRFTRSEVRALALRTALNEARLSALRMQLQPHFLFNTLNAISALVREDPVRAEKMITLLSDLLRTTLVKSDVSEVPLYEELEFVNRYLAIQVMRFGDRLEIRINIDPKASGRLVPWQILQPVVENAVTHGLSKTGSCFVEISAEARDDETIIRVRDEGPGLSDQLEFGIGLTTVRARLEQTYDGRARFDLSSIETGGCLVEIAIPRGASRNDDR